MEKLIELLNQYEIDRGMGSVFNIWKFAGELHYYNNDTDEFVFDNVKLYIISKGYGFIKRLVKNDKIDRHKAHEKIKELGKDYGWFDIYSGIVDNCLLMLLAISDNPIDFLIEILK